MQSKRQSWKNLWTCLILAKAVHIFPTLRSRCEKNPGFACSSLLRAGGSGHRVSQKYVERQDRSINHEWKTFSWYAPFPSVTASLHPPNVFDQWASLDFVVIWGECSILLVLRWITARIRDQKREKEERNERKDRNPKVTFWYPELVTFQLMSGLETHIAGIGLYGVQRTAFKCVDFFLTFI